MTSGAAPDRTPAAAASPAAAAAPAQSWAPVGLRSSQAALAGMRVRLPPPSPEDQAKTRAPQLARAGRQAAADALRSADPVEVLAVLELDTQGKLRLRDQSLTRLLDHQSPLVVAAARRKLDARR